MKMILHRYRVSYTIPDRGINLVTSIMLGRAFNSLWRARQDAVAGYYPECFTQARGAYEHVISALWLEQNPAYLDAYLWAIYPEAVVQPSKRLPSCDEMAKSLDLEDGPGSLYDRLSKFAHPRSLGLNWLVTFDEKNTHFQVGGLYDERGLRICLYSMFRVLLLGFGPLTALQERMLGAMPAQWLENLHRESGKVEHFLESTSALLMNAVEGE